MFILFRQTEKLQIVIERAKVIDHIYSSTSQDFSHDKKVLTWKET